MAPKQTSAPAPQSFETAMERLERIVEEMEGDKLPLEDLLERYEEGSKLVQVCQGKLETAERRVEIIARGASGKPQSIPFDPAAAAPSPAPAPIPTASPAKKTPADSDVSLF